MFNSKLFQSSVPAGFTPDQTKAWQTTNEQFSSISNMIEKGAPVTQTQAVLANLYTTYCVIQYNISTGWKSNY